MQTFSAHVRKDVNNQIEAEQTVAEHLRGTAELCKQFASEFNAGDQGYLAGIAHDIGKYSDAFQRRLLHNAVKTDHSTAGAFECARQNQIMAAICVAGHHSGLPDFGGRADNVDQATFCGRMNRAKAGKLPDYSPWTSEIVLPNAKSPSDLTGGAFGLDFYIRMLFSCLTDADYLDTEHFMSNGTTERDAGQPIDVLTEKLDRYVEKNWFPPDNPINRQRCAILKRCAACGDNTSYKPGFFTLTVPTGGGKTVASLAFALHHAKTQKKKRIIYVIPYTSIIEQTADKFREILGTENVLEHHSGVLFDLQDEAADEATQMMLATENWDKPVIVTTAVQFFESIYANRSSKCRKLHNLANSVIIFDEAQMIPIAHIRPCLSSIAQLVGGFGASAVLCTATQPALDGILHEFLPAQQIIELCPLEIYDGALFRRVIFENRGMTSWEEIAAQMQQSEQSLCIVNTRKSAKELYLRIKDTEGSYHLSTMMVPAHRRAVLAQIRERLPNALPCRVVSTSLIEAGVDVDFPLVFREVAGLDSILQAAGRCNREGKNPASESKVVTFRSETPVPPLFERNADVGRGILEQYSDISSVEAISDYFNKLIMLTGEAAQDKNRILPQIQSGTFPFATIAREFHLIDDDAVTVYIPWEKGAELIEHMKHGECNRALFREAAQYSVSLYHTHFESLLSSGAISAIDNQQGLWYLSDMALYDKKSGLSLAVETGIAHFV